MSSKSDKPSPSSERPGENVTPAVAAARLIRSDALFTANCTESTGPLSHIIDKLDYDEDKGCTAEMLPDDMAEDDKAASEGAPSSQSPSTQLKDEEFRAEADVAQGFYGADATAASPDSSAMEDKLIEGIDSQRGDAEDIAVLRTETVGSSNKTQYHTEDLVPGGTVVRRKVSDETVA